MALGLVALLLIGFKLNQDGVILFAKNLSSSDESIKQDNAAINPKQTPESPVTPISMQTPATSATPEPIAVSNDPNVLELLTGFILPIKGAKLPTFDGQLPNAKRAYRSGIHEGIDFYDGFVGVPVKIGTEVLAAKAGTVIRADTDYIEWSENQIKEWLALTDKLGYTPKEILDRLRGRQVWIDHGNNIITRYVHLSGIAPGIKPGSVVNTRQLIAYVGNSGSPEAAEGTNNDIHLHFEIWIGDQYLGQGLTPPQVKDRLKKVFP